MCSSDLFDLRALLAYALEVVAPRVKAQPVELKLTMAGDVPPFVRGDPSRLRQVVLNFLSNAAKFTERGTIELSVTARRESENDVRLRVCVSDTGAGIPRDRQGLLFHSFEQVDASISRRYGGTGLGLSISQRLARLMGGDIEVASTPGEGSVFTLGVPLARAKVALPAERGKIGRAHV